MPLYFFDIYDNDELVTDEVGVELESLHEAREQALTLLPDLAREEMPDGDRRDFTAVVRCHERRIRYRTTLSIRGEWTEPPDESRSRSAVSGE